jgi:hypothetical protein
LVEVFQNATNNARGVSDATASPHEGKREAVCIASPGKQVFPYSPVSPRKSMEGRRATSSTALASAGNQQAASNSHVSPIRSMAGRRVTSSTPPVSPRKLRRSMAGRRAASSTALGAGSNSGHPLFRRQFSLRGCIAEENFEAKQNRLHDYTSPQQGKRGTICIASPAGEQAAPYSHVSPRKSTAGRRATSSTPPASPREQATPNSHASLRRSMAGRRAASSTALGAGSNSGHPLFRRQFSLRGCIAEENSEAKQSRLHDYTSPQQGKRGTICIASSAGEQAAPYSHVSPRKLMVGRRATSSTPPVSPRRQAAPNSHASLRRSMVGRRAASSTALGAGSNSGHPLFRRQFSLRGCIPEENSEAKQSRLHDYTESPVGVCKLPFN